MAVDLMKGMSLVKAGRHSVTWDNEQLVAKWQCWRCEAHGTDDTESGAYRKFAEHLVREHA